MTTSRKFSNFHRVIVFLLCTIIILNISYPYFLLIFDNNINYSLRILLIGNFEIPSSQKSIHCGMRDYESFLDDSYKNLLSQKQLIAAESTLSIFRKNNLSAQAIVISINEDNAKIVYSSNVFRWRAKSNDGNCTRNEAPKIISSPTNGLNLNFGE